tara:strand:+ start:95 stop:1306 length:1212 start_codon:yes stop_codon:yes gene_type:complete
MNLLLKLYKSQKLKIYKNFIKEIHFYFGDIFIIFYCFLLNLIKLGKPYDKRVAIVTASDDLFAETLFQLLNNLNKYKFHEELIVYDLGMNDNQISYIKSEYPEVIIENFNFHNYPSFIGKRDDHGLLGHYAWKPNIIYETLEKYKKKVVWLDSANLINSKFIFVLIVLSNKNFFSPISAGTVKEYTSKQVLKDINYPARKLSKRNLTGGFNAFDWNDIKSRETAKIWRDYSNKEEMINPKDTNKSNSRHDQSLLTAVVYKDNYFGYLPKIKKIFGIRVNQNPNQDFFLFADEHNEYSGKLYFDWYKHYKNISTKTINYSKIIWVLNPKDMKRIPKKYLRNKKVLCCIYNQDDLLNLRLSNFIDAYLIFDTSITINNDKERINVNFETSLEEFYKILMNFKDSN